MSTSVPHVPPRPNRVIAHQSSSLSPEIPKIPPRPANRRHDRSLSPLRDSYTPSPLNELPTTHKNDDGLNVPKDNLVDGLDTKLCRPPSVRLPSVGQEGIEYSEAYVVHEEKTDELSKNCGIDSGPKIYAPKPSLPNSNTKKMVLAASSQEYEQDSTENYRKPIINGENYNAPSPLKTNSQPAFHCSNSAERPAANTGNENGIPQIGQIVPMYPHAGDVQAPPPAQNYTTPSTETGLFSDGATVKHHGRKLSGLGHEIPPDAYGRYGHGIITQDPFEKAYYKKHPELLKKEIGSYGDGRTEWAMSSEDLNKIVHETASRGTGEGALAANFGTPSEQIGFQASDEYTSRLSSPRPLLVTQLSKPENKIDSILESDQILNSKSMDSAEVNTSIINPQLCQRLENETSQDEIIHVDEPTKRHTSSYGSNMLNEPSGNLATKERSTEDHGYNAPILASDEVAKEPFSWEKGPAVSPLHEDNIVIQDNSQIPHETARESSQNGSKLLSEPVTTLKTSIGETQTTSLEDIPFEPLFPEEGKKSEITQVLMNQETRNRKFPSQDVWEDTPHSLQYTATVSEPQFPEQEKEQNKVDHDNETPAQAFARRHEELAEQESKNHEIFLSQERTKKNRAPKQESVKLEPKSRPPNHRFPSRDIWEDTPDSLLLQTTVAGPQVEKDISNLLEEQQNPELSESTEAYRLPQFRDENINLAKSSQMVKPSVPLRPTVPNLQDTQEQSQAAILGKSLQKPTPGRSSPLATAPKPKPQVPERPTKPISQGSSESISSPIISSIAAAKPKPAVPARTMGSKIAALQGGLMLDLSKRLRLGPQTPKKDEISQQQPGVEKITTLSDARKGRARGPARRAPKSTTIQASDGSRELAKTLQKDSFTSEVVSIWSIDPELNQLNFLSQKESD
ncbi:hypothetical protein BGHDH14_bgh04592 [Blumeria hordei DH14]|uniref:Altered inheritance of mitochondria protein 21 n=1 Tax=Blumeria graminis f. sp. hordei (strain DH14) TaxID=546991 RepID=N1JI58_BLUG1|nr:hypothetical protein BGHDH14_bgh04592 [Blumeria hordei DH14]